MLSLNIFQYLKKQQWSKIVANKNANVSYKYNILKILELTNIILIPVNNFNAFE